MPSRQLPYTDKMKYEAMKTAIEVSESLHADECGISKSTFNELLSTFSRFEQIYISRQKLKHDNDYKAFRNKARMYIEHYLQVLIMAVERGELPSDALLYYGLKPGSTKLPDLRTDNKLIDFGKFLFEADSKRILEGGKYITNPGIAVVKVWFEKYVSARENHRVQIEKYRNNKDFIEQIRWEAHACIKNTWDEIEMSFEHLSPALKRKAAAHYGVMYVESPREQAIRTAPSTGSLFNRDEIPEKEPEIRTVHSPKNTRILKPISASTENQASISFVMEDRH